MLSPTERPPASAAPRLAASISPGPPPVITAKPWSARQAAVSRQSSYQRWPSAIRAEPKTETPSSTSRRASKPRVDLRADPVEPLLVSRLDVAGNAEQVLVALRSAAPVRPAKCPRRDSNPRRAA